MRGFPGLGRAFSRGALFVALLVAVAAPAPAQDPDLRPARPAPLAARSLLLAGARVGDRLVAVGERGHILLSDDSGANWRQAPVPVNATLTAVQFVDARTGWAVGHDAVILRSDDAGESWTLQSAAPEREEPLMAVSFSDARTGLAVGAYGLCLATADGGAAWTECSAGAEEDRHLYAVAPVPGGRIMVGEAGLILRSEGGGPWKPVASPYPGSLFALLPLADSDLLAFGLQGNLLRSRDGGKSWASGETGTDAGLTGGIRLSDGRVVIVGDGGTVLTSDDGGGGFKVVQRPDRAALAAVLEAPDGRLVLLGERGALRAGKDGL